MFSLLRRLFRRRDEFVGYGVEIVESTSSVCELYRRAAVALGAGEVDRARALYERAQSLEPCNAQAFIGLGTCALRVRDPAQAVKYFKAALKLDATSASAHVGLGSAHFQLRRYAHAAESYVRAAQLRGDLADAHLGAASTFAKLNEHTKKRAHAVRYLELAPDSSHAPYVRTMLETSG